MAKRNIDSRRKMGDMEWVENVLKRMFVDARFTSLAEVEAKSKLEDCHLHELVLDLTDLDPDQPEPAPRPTPAKPPAPLVSGTRRISIRVHERVLLKFKQQAEKSRTPYQTLMKRALEEATRRYL